MICASCQQAEAVVFIKQLSDNHVRQTALCAACAAQAQEAFAPADALLKLLAQAGAARPHAGPARCPGCQLTFAEFRHEGRFGCPGCYDHFAPQLRGLIPRIHNGASLHRGRAPKKAPEA
ncbi:MAG: hypothetical protein AAB320_03580 [Elusimicrobiota bacterium]